MVGCEFENYMVNGGRCLEVVDDKGVVCRVGSEDWGFDLWEGDVGDCVSGGGLVEDFGGGGLMVKVIDGDDVWGSGEGVFWVVVGEVGKGVFVNLWGDGGGFIGCVVRIEEFDSFVGGIGEEFFVFCLFYVFDNMFVCSCMLYFIFFS